MQYFYIIENGILHEKIKTGKSEGKQSNRMNRHNEGHRERKLPVEREAQEEDLARRRRQMMRMRQEKRRKRRIRV